MWKLPKKNKFEQEVICSQQNTMCSASPVRALMALNPGFPKEIALVLGSLENQMILPKIQIGPGDLNHTPSPLRLYGAH